MKYIVKPSLEHIALVKIIVTLWDQNDVRALITKLSTLYFREKNEEWQKIEDKISQKVSQLLLPQSIKMKLLGFIKPIGLQIIEWMRYHDRCFYLHVDLPAKLYWLPQGTIDRKRTAEVLIKDENLDISTRYKLACMYCLEDAIQKLWDEMSENLKGTFLYEDFPKRSISWQSVVFFWTRNMKQRDLGNAQAHTSSKSAFKFCAKVGTKAAAEYFYLKLTPKEREESMMKTAKYVANADILCFLLSKIDEEQLIEVFKYNPSTVLRCFLNWPLQSKFITLADCMWNILSKKHYIYLLENIIDKIENGYKDWNYKNLISEFWQKSPNALKSFNAVEFDNGCLKSILLKIKDKEILGLILEGVTLTEKKKLIYSFSGRNICCHLLLDNQWDLLECFIKTCLSSKSEKINFKEDFEKRIKEFRMRVIRLRLKNRLRFNKQKWNQSFGLSDDSVCKNNKRSIKEDESSSSKRLCDLRFHVGTEMFGKNAKDTNKTKC